jgi:chitinase
MHKLGTCLLITLALAAFCSAAVTKPTGQKIVGYWGCFPGNLPTRLDQLETAINKGYNVIIYAFYLVDKDGGLYQDPGSMAAPAKNTIHANREFSYLISLFGGQNGAAPTLTLSADAWALNMFNNFKRLHEMYGFDGIDIDLENAWGGTGDRVACALRTFFKLMHNAGFVVSMAPQTTAVYPGIGYGTGSWNSYVPLLDSSIIDYVDIVAIQLYNNVIPFDDPAAYTDALVKGFQVTGCPTCDGTVTGYVKVPACKIAHGWPSTVGAAPSGCPGLPFPGDKCPYGNALQNLYKGSASLTGTAGMMTWAIEWDEKDSWKFITSATAITYSGASCGASPSTPKPTVAPPTAAPTERPVPTNPPTQAPTKAPTQAPTKAPTQPPTQAPTKAPTQAPTKAPTSAPTTAPTQAPTKAPTTAPTTAPTKAPTTAPTTAPTKAPTKAPTSAPGRCNIKFEQKLDSQWDEAAGKVSTYTVRISADVPLRNLKFSLAPQVLRSIWDASSVGNGVYQLPSWMYTDGVIPVGATYVSFGYIIAGNEPATITVQGDAC